jgi:glutaredoxin 3
MDDELMRIRRKKLRELMKKKEEKSMTKKVIVYSTSTCPYCVMAKNYLESLNVEFEYVNVQEDKAKAQEMIEKSGQMGVPVLDIGGEVIVGFNKPAVDAALKKAGLTK